MLRQDSSRKSSDTILGAKEKHRRGTQSDAACPDVWFMYYWHDVVTFISIFTALWAFISRLEQAVAALGKWTLGFEYFAWILNKGLLDIAAAFTTKL